MKLCPKCKEGVITLEPIFRAKPLLNYSIAGKQVKAVVEQLAVVTCSSCDFRVRGRLEGATVEPDGTFTGGHFVEVRDG